MTNIRFVRAKVATMKAIALSLALFALVALLVAPVAAQENDPSIVVRAYLDAVVAKNLDTALAHVADNVTHTDTHAAPGLPSVTKGTGDFGAFLKGFLDDPGYRLEYANMQASGDSVTWTAKEWFDVNNLPPNFPLPIESHLQAVVANGKITAIILDNDPAWLKNFIWQFHPKRSIQPQSCNYGQKPRTRHDLDKSWPMLPMMRLSPTRIQRPAART